MFPVQELAGLFAQAICLALSAHADASHALADQVNGRVVWHRGAPWMAVTDRANSQLVRAQDGMCSFRKCVNCSRMPGGGDELPPKHRANPRPNPIPAAKAVKTAVEGLDEIEFEAVLKASCIIPLALPIAWRGACVSKRRGA
jgi:hypothetical protein